MADSGWGTAPIQITKHDALSSHVDDLLKRQMNLRGETGMTRDRGRRWYYQNWFVFLIVGAVAAVAAWAILEPFFADIPYTQGKIEKIDADATLSPEVPVGEERIRIQSPRQCLITLNGEPIWILAATRLLNGRDRRQPVDCSQLAVGQQVGVYAEYFDIGEQGLAFAGFVDPSPKADPRRAGLSLRRSAARGRAAALLLFPLVAGLVGLAIGAIDGIICRVPRRALLAGAVGCLVGFVGGFISCILAGLIYVPLNRAATDTIGRSGHLTTFGFVVQMIGRSLAWMLAGMGMGLGQGIALRSKRLLLYGFVGGIVGGLLGGVLFDPIDLVLLSPDRPSAYISRLIGLLVIGAAVGAMIGIVELLTRDTWLRMLQGPLAGKEFLVFKDVMNIGSSPRCEIYLFNDNTVASIHARLRTVGSDCEIENMDNLRPTLLNGRPFSRSRLRHGDQIGIGRTTFAFQQRQG